MNFSEESALTISCMGIYKHAILAQLYYGITQHSWYHCYGLQN